MSERGATLTNVHSFWNTEACGTSFIAPTESDREFYDRFREFRYRTEWHIPELVPFAEGRDKSVLEIGLGNGADGAMWATNGAHYTGVDLTETAVEATRKHFEVLGLKGRFEKQNAEHLSFADEAFDIVYSHGVLHHTPRTQQALDEVHRVLKPGGRAIVMLYHKHSFNYFIRIMGYMRARLLVKILSRAPRWKRDRAALRSPSVGGIRGNERPEVWDVHYENFLREGWGYLRAKNFVHHCTDGPECPVAFAFSKTEARDLFSKFREVQFRVAHFPLRKYSDRIPFALECTLARRLGWYLFIFATK
ncbi:MAG: class I SAM-dependent methyltransferase [Verrucomicrobiota bacterium]|nr:class I SAM-dependent methyltransferase [Verrucomicrobiota bacterium]